MNLYHLNNEIKYYISINLLRDKYIYIRYIIKILINKGGLLNFYSNNKILQKLLNSEIIDGFTVLIEIQIKIFNYILVIYIYSYQLSFF